MSAEKVETFDKTFALNVAESQVATLRKRLNARRDASNARDETSRFKGNRR